VTVLGSLCALNNLVTSGRFRLIFFAARTFGCLEIATAGERVRAPNGRWPFVPNAGN
jgi:hypothetical protein